VIIGGKMSTAKERYYEFKSIADKCFEGVRDPIHEYVAELEQELLEQKEIAGMWIDTNKILLKQKAELEQEKAELIELIKRIAIANGIDPEKLELLQKHNTK